jgi:hypothetical protein
MPSRHGDALPQEPLVLAVKTEDTGGCIRVERPLFGQSGCLPGGSNDERNQLELIANLSYHQHHQGIAFQPTFWHSTRPSRPLAQVSKVAALQS